MANVSTTVKMKVGRDFTSEHTPPDAAIVNVDNVLFRIHDPFAAYLAARNNAELAAYLEVKAAEIRLFLDDMEARVTRT